MTDLALPRSPARGCNLSFFIVARCQIETVQIITRRHTRQVVKVRFSAQPTGVCVHVLKINSRSCCVYFCCLAACFLCPCFTVTARSVKPAWSFFLFPPRYYISVGLCPNRGFAHSLSHVLTSCLVVRPYTQTLPISCHNKGLKEPLYVLLSLYRSAELSLHRLQCLCTLQA